MTTMNSHLKFLLILAFATLVMACASSSEPMMNDGITDSAPIGSNVKTTRTTYRRGGSSSSVKIMTRENLDEEGVTADDVLKPD